MKIIFNTISKIKKYLSFLIFLPNLFIIKITAKKSGKIRINGLTRINQNTTLGTDVNFNGLKVIGRGNLKIGNHFHSGPNCLIITESHNYDDGTSLPYDSSYIYKDVTIEDNVWLGANVIIIGKVTLKEGCIIQAGSVVTQDVPPLAISGGNPAHVFKYRNSNHYYELKKTI